MNAGQLRESVTIERLTRTRTPSGAQEQAWTALTTRRAQVAPVRSEEVRAAMVAQNESVMPFQVSLRAPVDVTERDRLQWRGRTLNIRQVQESVPGVRVDLLCVETR